MIFKIEVTQEDIENGVPCKSLYCPIALAVSRKLGIPVYIGIYTVCAEHNDLAKLPYKATKWITQFDIGRKVEPFSFDLDVMTIPYKAAGGPDLVQND